MMASSDGSMVYEFGFEPEIGEATEIVPGVKWLRLPLPFLLGHIRINSKQVPCPDHAIRNPVIDSRDFRVFHKLEIQMLMQDDSRPS